MRFCSLLIERYGCFDRALIPLDPAPGRINLIVAPNGAGKSVLRQAFHDLLFGIPLQSDMKFRFDYADMHLHAEAIDADGSAFGFGWRRRGSRTFSEPADDAKRRFDAAILRITPRQVEHLFALDTHRLREGGRELARGGDGLGVALLSGTGELASARAVRNGLDARRGVLWKPTGRSGELIAAVKALEEARKALRDAVQAPRQREKLEEEIAEQAALHAEAEARFAAAWAADRRLTRIERVRPHLRARTAALLWLEQHQDAPALPAGLSETLRKSVAAQAQAASSLTERREFAALAQANAESIVRDEAALLHEDRFAAFAERVGKAAAQRRDLPEVERHLRDAQAEVARALRDLGADLTPGAMEGEDGERQVPPIATVERTRKLIADHAVLEAAGSAARARLAEAERVLALIEEEQDAADLPDPQSLRALLDAMRAEGDPIRRAAMCAEAARAAIARETACLARIPSWSGGIEALRALPTPADAQIARLDQARIDAAAGLREAAASLARLDEERAAAQRSADALQDASVPDRFMLAAARAERDRLWGEIHRQLHDPRPLQDGGRPYDDAEDGAPLPVAFQRSLRCADDVADRLTADLVRVEEKIRLAASLRQSLPELERLRRDAAAAQARLDQARADWALGCAPLGLGEAASLGEARAWLAARLEAIAAAETADALRAERDAIAEAHLGWAGRLARELDVPPGPLAALIAQADLALATREALAKAAIDRQARRRAARHERSTALEAVARAEAQSLAWHDGWIESLRALGRPDAETASATATILPRLDDLRLHAADAAGKAVRVRDMREELAGFEAEVERLAHSLDEPLGMPGPGDRLGIARAMIARLDRARRQETQWTESQASLAAASQAGEKAARTERAAAAALAACLAECGAATPREAEDRLALSQSQQEHRDAILRAEQALGAEGGFTIAALEDEAAAMPADIDAARGAAEAAVTHAKAASEAARVTLEQCRQRLSDAQNATTANAAASDQQAAAALVSRLLDEELVLGLAASMLGQAIDAMEQGAGDAAIGRISRAFGAVTDGAYAIRAGDDGSGGTVLRAVERDHPNEHKAIAELSEGTRDQLYLALRLVALEDHLDGGPTLPFIADDVLQTFDDTRALASLRALLDLSRIVQVIVLTHHAHLLDVAASLPPGSVHVHRLA